MLVFLSVFFPNNVEMIMIVMAWWWRYWWWRLWEKGGSLLLSITTPWGRGAPRSTSSNKVDYHHHLRRSFLGSDQKRKTEKLGLFVQIRKDQVLNWGHHHKRLELIWATSSTKKIPHFLVFRFLKAIEHTITIILKRSRYQDLKNDVPNTQVSEVQISIEEYTNTGFLCMRIIFLGAPYEIEAIFTFRGSNFDRSPDRTKCYLSATSGPQLCSQLKNKNLENLENLENQEKQEKHKNQKNQKT